VKGGLLLGGGSQIPFLPRVVRAALARPGQCGIS
jgi:hypothetical protein